MKIEWLSPTMDRAIVTVGFWRWKRRAEVYKGGYGWYFAKTRAQVPGLLSWRIDRAEVRVTRAQIRASRESSWERIKALPEAKVVRRG